MPHSTLSSPTYLNSLPRRWRQWSIAHDIAPGRAEFGIDVGVPSDAVRLHRLDQDIDTAGGIRRIVWALGFSRLVARVVNDEIDVGVECGGAADVGASPQFFWEPREKQTLVDADVAARRARALVR